MTKTAATTALQDKQQDFLATDMIKIAGFFWQICLLRASPSQIPGNPVVLGAVLGIYCLTALLALAVTRTNHTMLSILGIVLVGVLIQGSLVFALLAFKRLGQRFYATWSAMLPISVPQMPRI